MNTQRVAGLVLVMVGCLLLLPTLAWAQASATGNIAGVVRDTSGGVLPGVTVEAASPALIEKVRAVVTDDQGLYRIVDLRPGTYTVTFTLPGFASLRREGVELTTSFTATVNAELKVGGLEETITVSGATPVVDTQNVRQQTTLSRATLDALPTTKRLGQYASLIPGATYANPTFQDVGGNQGEGGAFAIHGQRPGDLATNFEGINQSQLGLGVYSFNAQMFQEVVVEIGGTSAEAVSGGVQLNIISKDGGNTLSGSFNSAYAGPKLQNGNLTDELRARGLATDISIKKSYDHGGALGGPIKKDKLWFFTAHRWWGAQRYIQGSYFNKLQGTQVSTEPVWRVFFYEPDLDRVTHNWEYFRDHTLRLTWQAAQKHKIVGSFSLQANCSCPFGLTGVGGLNAIKPAPESRGWHVYDPQYLPLVSWSYPATSRLLFEAGTSAMVLNEDSIRQPYVGPNDIRVTDLALNIAYGSDANTNNWGGSYVTRDAIKYNSRFAASYITGSHAFKAGFSMQRYVVGRAGKYTDVNQINGARSYTFRNRVPQSVTIWAVPFEILEHTTNLAVHVQDQWTVRKVTLNLGLRYESLNGAVPEQHLPAGHFVPARDFPAVKDVPNWKNLNPRLGVSYDLFGDGRTALKMSLGRYVPYTVAAANNPAVNQAANTTRTWNDANGNYVPDCDLKNPVANGECGQWSDLTFGQLRAGTRFADDALHGFNKQFRNWQGSVSIQQELRPRMALNVGYFRTWYGNFTVTDNQLVTPADYDPYCITAPVDSRLPGGGGNQLCGFYDIKPEKFGRFDNLITQASHYGKRKEVYNGVDVTLNTRFGEGGQFSGGLSVGRTMEDYCFVVDSPGLGAQVVLFAPAPEPNVRPGFCKITRPWAAATQVKFLVVYPLPWDLQTSAIYQNIPGIPIAATYPAPNAQIAPLLGRNVGQCRGAATCNANVNIDLIPPNTVFEDRLQQVDLRLTRLFRIGRVRVRGNLDVANVFNASNVLSVNAGYGPRWMVPYEIMGGRLFRLSSQLDF